MKKIIFFSKNDRSFFLFRKCWLIASEKLECKPLFYNRGIGAFNLLRSLWRFAKNFKNKRVVFGFTEILIYIPFSKKNDVFVFTGLGRLLLQDGFLRKILKFYLFIFYRNQSVIVLNQHDREFLSEIFSISATVIDGEGYFFQNLAVPKNMGKSGMHFAYVGRLLKSKQVDVLLDAFSMLPPAGCCLSLYGDSDFGSLDSISDEEIEYFVSKSQNEIIRRGYHDNVKKELQGVDVVISMSKREGLPFSVLDSIDCGCYLVLSPVPGHLSFYGFEGIEYCDADSLYSCLKAIIDDKGRIANINFSRRVNEADKKFGHVKIIGAISSVLSG